MITFKEFVSQETGCMLCKQDSKFLLLKKYFKCKYKNVFTLYSSEDGKFSLSYKKYKQDFSVRKIVSLSKCSKQDIINTLKGINQVDTKQLISKIESKFPEVSVSSFYKEDKIVYCVFYYKEKKYKRKVRNFYDSINIESIIQGNKKAAFDRLSYRRHEVMQSFLDSNNLTEFTFKWESTTDTFKVFKLKGKKNFQVVSYWTLLNVILKHEDPRLYFLKSFYAKVRHNSKIPLLYSDKEWKNLILELTNKEYSVISKYIPVKPGDRRQPQTFKHNSCGTVFSKTAFAVKGINKLKLSCPLCRENSHRHSKIADKWLVDVESWLKINIYKPSTNKNEFRFKLSDSSFISVDGYNKKFDIVFEFHGSRFHGNPLLFYPDDKCNPWSQDKSYSFLKKTYLRELRIIDSGCVYIRIWDEDFLDEKRYTQWKRLTLKRLKQHGLFQSKNGRLKRSSI